MSYHYVDKLLYEAQGAQWEVWSKFRKLSEELTKLNGGVTIVIGVDVDIQETTVEQLLTPPPFTTETSESSKERKNV